MISLEPERVFEEVRAQQNARDAYLAGVQSLIEKYPGEWWAHGGSSVSETHDAENAGFEYVSYAMSQLVWANPRWRVTTRRPRAQQFVAEAMQWSMNRWTSDAEMKPVLEDLAVDYTFGWGVAHVTPRRVVESYESEDPLFRPQLSRISPWDFGWDHRAPSYRRSRMSWHRYRIDKEDLLELAERDRELPRGEREKWDMAAIESLSTSSGVAETMFHGRKPWGAGLSEDSPDREQVEVYSVWFPLIRLPGKPGPEDGFNGAIGTYAVSSGLQSPVEIKAPAPYYGPRWGPYTLMGCYIVPDSPFPLSVLTANAGNIHQTTRISKAVDAQVEAYKRMGITSDRLLAQLIKDGRTDHVYPVMNPRIEEIFRAFEVGGTTPGNVAAYQMFRERRDRGLGMDDVQRGVVRGEGTATEVDRATEAALGRQGYVKARFQDGVRRFGKTIAWYLYHDDRTVIPLGEEGKEALEAYGIDEEEEVFFIGGSHDDGSGATFDDLGLEAEPYSMERPSEGMLRGQAQLIAQVVQMAPQFVMLGQMGADVRGLIDAYGDSFGMPKLSRFFPGIESVDPSMIQPMEAEPRMANDIGAAGAFRYMRGGHAGGQTRPEPQAQYFKVPDLSQLMAGAGAR